MPFCTKLGVMVSSQVGVEMGRNAREYVEQKHDIAKIIEVYKQNFVRIMQEKGGS